MLISILLYLLIHDINRLYILKLCPQLRFITYIRNYVLEKSIINFENKIIKNYLVDFLWILSLNFIMSYYYSKDKIYKYIVIIGISFLSEILQYIKPIFGTFDFVDLGIYFIVTFCFFIYDCYYKSSKYSA